MGLISQSDLVKNKISQRNTTKSNNRGHTIYNIEIQNIKRYNYQKKKPDINGHGKNI